MPDESDIPPLYRLDDETLLRALADTAEAIDQPPPWLARLGESMVHIAFPLRDVPVAELVADDLLAVRATGVDERLIALRTDDLEIELQHLERRGDESAWAGQLIPPAPATIIVEQPSRPAATVEADERGRFELTTTSPTARLRIERDGRTVAQTRWLEL